MKMKFQDYVNLGNSGTQTDVDQLMALLSEQTDLLTIKLVDNALGLVSTQEGRQQLRYYLFTGNLVQRNYAALYFKRRGWTDLIEEAFAAGKIDRYQAFSE